MAQCKLTAQELTLAAFSPIIGVLCSSAAKSSCQKNNLDFAEMLQPFCQLTLEGQIRDPNSGGQVLTIRSLRLTSRDAHARPPQTTLARRLLNESVSESICERQTLVRSAGVELEIPVSVPWFDNWQETFLHVQYPFDHEFSRHYMACILVVTAHEPSPLEEFQKLSAQLQEMQAATNKAPKWFPDLFKYYLILDDASDTAQTKPEELLHSLRSVHSPKHCQLLRINSRRPDPLATVNEQEVDPWKQFLGRREENNSDNTDWLGDTVTSTVSVNSPDLHPLSPDTDTPPLQPPAPVLHGSWLSQEDREKITQMLKTFCYEGLFPYLESQLQILTEAVANRKGVSRSLLSATKRWFGGAKPGTLGAAPPPSAVAYAADASELQLRRLGDLWFLLGQWPQAFQAYHSAKREFGAEQAWLHYAGALEMAALASFLQGEVSAQRKAQEYMEEAIATYVHWCRMPALATRATLLSTVWLRAKGQHGEAARQLLRMSGEDSDLRSALLLEQAAYCFLAGTPLQLPRKYAFHAVLAGHRYGKAGQRRHSLRLYKQALQVYKCDGWALAHDHLHFTAGRHAASLRELELASQSFEKLLAGTSNQPSSQQALFLREYISTHLELKASCPRIPLPILDQASLRVLIGAPPVERQDGNVSASDVTLNDTTPIDPLWTRFEEIALSEAQGASHMVFKPTVRLFGPGSNNNINIARGVVNEPISLSVRATNPLGVALVLQNLSLSWSFLPSTAETEDKEQWLDTTGPIISEEVPETTLPPKSSSIIQATLTPGASGKLRFTGLQYNLLSADVENGDSESLSLRGHQFWNEPFPQVQVIGAAPRLEIALCEVPHRLLNGEVLRLPLRLANEGTLDIERVLVVGPTRLFCFEEEPSSSESNGAYVVKNVHLPADGLQPKQRYSTVLWLRPSNQVPDMRLLFYYETKEGSFSGYRLVRHQWSWPVLDGVNVTVTCQTASDSPAFVIRLNNESDVAQVSAFGLSLQSKQLRLISNATPAATAAAAASLGPGQVLHLVAHARRRPPNDLEAAISHLHLGIKDSNSHINGRPFTSFLTTSPVLVVRWQATLIEPSGSPRTVIGQHHISLAELCGPTLGPAGITSTSDTLEQLEALKHQATCTLKHAHRVQHDFKQTRICVVPVRVTVCSRTHTPICVRIHTWRNSYGLDDLQPRLSRLSIQSGDSSLHQQQLYSPRCSNQLAWVGHAGAHVNLQPQTSHDLQMNVAVGCPGVYDVGSRLEIWVRSPNDPERSAVLQAWRVESSLIVTAAGQ